MIINYSKAHKDVLIVRTDQGMDIEFIFSDRDLSSVDADGDLIIEDLNSDNIRAFFFQIDGEFLSLSKIIDLVTEDWDRICDEIETDAINAESHIEQMRDPWRYV